MPWVKLDDNFYLNPKTAAIPMGARGLWVTGLSYCARNLTDGVITKKAVRQLGGTPTQVKHLVEAGLWLETPEGYMFHDYLDFNPSKAQVEARRLRDRFRKAGGDVGVKSKTQGVVDKPQSGCDTNTPDGVENLRNRERNRERKRVDFENFSNTKSTRFLTYETGEEQGKSEKFRVENHAEGRAESENFPRVVPYSRCVKEGGEKLKNQARGFTTPPFENSNTGQTQPAASVAVPLGPPGCPKHAHLANWERPNCAACAQLRIHFEQELAERARVEEERKKAAREAEKAAITACPLCDPFGHVEIGRGVVAKCDHNSAKKRLKNDTDGTTPPF